MSKASVSSMLSQSCSRKCSATCVQLGVSRVWPIRLSRRATAVLCLAEGNRMRGKDRTQLFRTAAGSADEVRAGIELAAAGRYVTSNKASEPLNLLDLLEQLLAVLWRLTEGR